MTFYNIFSDKKENKNKIKPKIIVDIHEKNSLVLAELCNTKEAEIEINSLQIGDYLIDNIVIERKTFSDFISSMISKRLVQQLKQMKEYSKQILIIEGFENPDLFKKETRLNPNSTRGFLLSIILNYKVPIIFSKDYIETSKYLILLAKKQLKPKTVISLHSRIPKTLEEQRNYVLESFPNLGPITSRKLLEKFRTIKNVINADEEDLKKVLGKKYNQFKDIIN
jgi:ERCC4-type nuclease